jgi:Uma2 family endonuclease
MASSAVASENLDRQRLPVKLQGMPILYEDEKEADLGEVNRHVLSDETLHICLMAHFADQPEYRVYSNMNLYYSERLSPLPYVSPDTMVVKPRRRTGKGVRSYHISRDGPAPLFVAEVLSVRSWEQRDTDEKVVLYATLGISEYAMVDVTGQLMSKRLLLNRLQKDGTYRPEQDPDGGITSQLGFRLIIDKDGDLRVVNAKTGYRYPRPLEAMIAACQATQRPGNANHAEESRPSSPGGKRLRKPRKKRKS